MCLYVVASVFSVNAIYLEFGNQNQKNIQMLGPTTCPRLDLGYGKQFFLAFAI
jgi:hypothetical protein